MKVICISGKARHGKDTTAAILKEYLEEAGYSSIISHYADLLKYICKKFFMWDGEKNDRGREILQIVGTDIIRKEEPNFWVEFIAKIIKLFPNEWEYMIIPDCRFPNELNYLKNNGIDVTHIRVFRDNFDNGLTEEQNKHISETALDGAIPDITLMNDGDILNLRLKTAEILPLIGVNHQMSFDEIGVM